MDLVAVWALGRKFAQGANSSAYVSPRVRVWRDVTQLIPITPAVFVRAWHTPVVSMRPV
jgi:hypothetical protein